jgi:predicted transcriptional regulator
MPRKPYPNSEKKQPIGARLRPDMLERLQALADADRRTLSFMVEEAVREYLAKHDVPSPKKPR